MVGFVTISFQLSDIGQIRQALRGGTSAQEYGKPVTEAKQATGLRWKIENIGLRQAIEKAKQFSFDLKGAVMASDAFFPFNDCVKMGHEAGIVAFIQPGGSIRDKDSIDYCVENKLAMVMTGMRHFKH